jgi:16S rRNA pseudouridine516 synthase
VDGDVITIDIGDSDDLWQLQFEVKQTVTILLHKPAGYVCSEIDEWWHLSYKMLLEDCIYAPMLRVVGRLDQDTTGLVLATSDWQLNHRLTSPKSHKEKEYIVKCEKELSDSDLAQLEQGVELDDGYQTFPAKTVRIDAFSFTLIITEWKYHQIKRMCEAIGNLCIGLQRVRIDRWTIEGLEEGKWREIT